jgi:3-hydroxybutyryl-CoA dehydrogenase
LAAERAAAALALLEVSAGLDRVGEADLVLEAVPEDLAVKRAVFADLDKLARPGAVLATGTSSLPVVACARATGRPEDVLGIHFFHPVPAMRLAEVVRTPYTADRTVAVAGALCSALGKRAVHCHDRAGFVVNALLLPYLNEAVGLLEQTYAADDIDTVMRDGCGFPMGPLELLDMIGIDICLAVQHRLFEAFQEPDLRPAGLLEDLVRSGYLGRKSQRGFRAR